MDLRLTQAHHWLDQRLPNQSYSLSLLSGDASFRRYFRVTTEGKNYALMDAPPKQENSEPFFTIGQSWRAQGIAVPQIFAEDLNTGFLLLEDFGDNTFFSALKSDPDNLYQQAMDALIPIQSADSRGRYTLPIYNERLLRLEIGLFTDWLLGNKLRLQITAREQRIMGKFFDTLVANALEQPRVVVHRDYHSRNLMIKADRTLGILDYQDAVMGPVTYDLVSLLRDCYIKWPSEKVRQWTGYYLHQLNALQGIVYQPDVFARWFDLMGLQRHLKAAGIFARLSLRDGKHTYLNDIPRTVSYLVDVSAGYKEFADVNRWLEKKLLPELASVTEPEETKGEKF